MAEEQDPAGVRTQGVLGFEAPSGEQLNRLLEVLRPRKTIRLAVSGDVLLTQLELDLVSTKDFQRLRRVRQLGTVCFVYPTALHTRFDHSLGVLSTAETMVRAVRNNTHSSPDERLVGPDQECLVRLYALLHDVPHVPFGHTIEDELQIFTRHDKNTGRIQRFLGPESEIGKVIRAAVGDEMHRRFLSVYTWDGADTAKLLNPDDACVYDLVSNTVCADLLDYLARDSYFCNLGVALEYRFLNFLYLARYDGARRVFIRLWKPNKPTPRRDTLTDLGRLLEARYLIAERAYFHHAKIVSGAMVGRALQEAASAGEIAENDLYDHSDDTLLWQLARSRNETAARLAQALRARSLHKILKTFRAEDFAGPQHQDFNQNAFAQTERLSAEPGYRREVENRIADEVGVRHGEILLYAPPREKGMNMKAADMLVLWKGGEPSRLRDVDDPVIGPRLKQIIAAHRALWGISIIVSRTLSDKQEELARDHCNILFMGGPASQGRAFIRYYRDVLEQYLAKAEEQDPLAPRVFRERLDAAAEELATTAHDSRPWRARLEAVVRKYFRAGRS